MKTGGYRADRKPGCGQERVQTCGKVDGHLQLSGGIPGHDGGGADGHRPGCLTDYHDKDVNVPGTTKKGDERETHTNGYQPHTATVVLFLSKQALGCNKTVYKKCNSICGGHPSFTNNHFRTKTLVLGVYVLQVRLVCLRELELAK